MVQYGAGVDLGRVLSGVVLATTLLGCASDPQVGKEVAELNKKLITVENDNARLELRIASLESQVDHLGSRQQAIPESGTSRPRLKVIKLSPQNEVASPGPMAENEPMEVSSGDDVMPQPAPVDAQDGERPVIRVDGDKVIDTGLKDSAAAQPGPKGGQRGDG